MLMLYRLLFMPSVTFTSEANLMIREPDKNGHMEKKINICCLDM
jgi:hypothetical protein